MLSGPKDCYLDSLPLFQDHVPIDGIVRAGRSTIDESSFTSEPLPLTKLPGVLLWLYAIAIFLHNLIGRAASINNSISLSIWSFVTNL